MDTEDGQFFIKNLAHFVRTHEKALANALQLRRQQTPKHLPSQNVSATASGNLISPMPTSPTSFASSVTTSSTLAAALSLPYLTFASHNIKPAKLALTPHHLFYLLSRFEELGVPVGPMNIRLENLHADSSASNYVSFLSKSQRPKGRDSDRGSIHSVSSVRSVMSGMSSLWANFGLGPAGSAARTEKQKAAIEADLKYLYSAFTKIPCLRLAPDRRARLIEGYEEFPFDTAVPLLAFKNISALEIGDIDIRQFFGWDRLAEQLRSLTVKRAGVDDPADLLINIVLDDMDKRRRRSSKAQTSPTTIWATSSSPKRSPILVHAELVKSVSAPGSPNDRAHLDDDSEVGGALLVRSGSDGPKSPLKGRPRSNSPVRPTSSRTGSAHSHLRGSYKVKRSGSGSSHSSMSESWHNPRGSSSNLLPMGILPPSKWRFLKHLSLADNGLTSISAASLIPLANTLHSLDLSSNLFSQIPDCLASLSALRALNLSNCMIDSLHSLTRNPLPAITALNLRLNRLTSLAGIERLYPLERLDLRDNRLTDPTELARLTGIPDLREVWVAGNPFTRTHSSHRITIFNLFRNTPGYADDILIDTYAPSYSERRYLMERVPERANVPVVKPPTDYGLSTIDVSRPIIDYPAAREPSVPRKEPATFVPTSSEVHTSSSGRKKRTPKRRIVDLSTSDLPLSKQNAAARFSTGDTAPPITAGSDSGYGISPHSSPTIQPSPVSNSRRTQHHATCIETPLIPQLSALEAVSPCQVPPPIEPPIEAHLGKDPQDWKLSGETYRKKLEALRNDVGHGWLSVLSEEGWESQRGSQNYGTSEYSPSGAVHPTPTTPRANSQQTIHSGRTLG